MTTTDAVLDKLECFSQNNSADKDAVECPDYSLYACAPFWLPHQAVCLLCEISVIDKITLQTMLGLNSILLMINKSFGGVKTRYENERFDYFIAKALAFPHKKLPFVRNLSELITRAIDERTLFYQPYKLNQEDVRLLCPVQTLIWAQRASIPIPKPLCDILKLRQDIELLRLPKTFPDQIDLWRPYNARQMLARLKKTGWLSVVEGGGSLVNKPAASSFEKRDEPAQPESLKEEAPGLTKRGHKQYETCLDARGLALMLALEAIFEDEMERSRHMELIATFTKVNPNEFTKYNTGRTIPGYLVPQHKCRSIARLLRHFHPDLSVQALYSHPAMLYGHPKSKKPALKTFRRWLSKDGISNRKERK